VCDHQDVISFRPSQLKSSKYICTCGPMRVSIAEDILFLNICICIMLFLVREEVFTLSPLGVLFSAGFCRYTLMNRRDAFLLLACWDFFFLPWTDIGFCQFFFCVSWHDYMVIFFSLWMWWIIVIDSEILNKSCIPTISHTLW
jgi:hypothetical protein